MLSRLILVRRFFRVAAKPHTVFYIVIDDVIKFLLREVAVKHSWAIAVAHPEPVPVPIPAGAAWHDVK